MNTNPTANDNSSFANVFHDSKKSKIALYHYMDQYSLSIKDTEAVPNFISLAPQYRKRFYVPEDAIPEMLELLNICYKEGLPNNFYELQDTNEVKATGLVFQFEFNSERNKIEFESVVNGFVRILFRDILTRWLSFSEDKEDHYCFYLSTKNALYDRKTLKFKSTFRIVIPSIMIDSNTRYFIYQRVWQSVEIKTLFEKKLQYHVRDCFKRDLRTVPFTLIGSCDPDQNEYLNLENVIKLEVENGETDGESSVVPSIDSRLGNIIYEASINYPCESGTIVKCHYLPTEQCVQKMEKDFVGKQLFQMGYDEARASFIKQSVSDRTIEVVNEMVGMLSQDRFDNLDEWLQIIKSLASEGNRYKSIAIMMTKDRAQELISWEDFCKHWEDATNSVDRTRYSSKALRYWASCDSPSRMNRFLDECIRLMLEEDVCDSLIHGRIHHSHIASYLKFMFKNVYVTHNVTKTSIHWYEFVTPFSHDIEPGQLYKWRCIGNQPDGLSDFISRDFKDIAIKVHSELKSRGSADNENEKDDPKVKYAKSLFSAYDKAIVAIFNNGFKRSVIDEAAVLFKRNHFIKQLDKPAHILGVGNGVVEFNGPDAKLLSHYHTYPISLYTDTNYVPYDENSKYVKTVYKMLYSLVPDDEIDALDFILYYFSTSLDWLTKESLFLIVHGGGCHAIDTPIRMFDGSLKMVQDVSVGDKIMGDDNTTRTVQELFRGSDDMFRILPIKGESFVVNKDHVLSLKFTNLCSVQRRDDGVYNTNPKFRAVWFELNGSEEPKKKSKTCNTKEDAKSYLNMIILSNQNVIKKGDIIDIKVCDLMKWSKWWLSKSNLSLYKSSGVSYPEKELYLDPYMLGYWLGDGTSSRPEITTMDPEVVSTFKQRLPCDYDLRKGASAGKADTYRIVDTKQSKKNRILDFMRECDVINNKHIPFDYKTSSITQRLELLAGILDSDGHYQSSMNQYELTLKNEKLFDDCLDLVRSLGFAAYKAKVFKTCTNAKNGPVKGTYYRMQIYGEGLETIPCKIQRKQATPRIKSKNALLNGFAIKSIGRGDYYGFELDGNHRYLTGDHYVHHNSNGKTVLMELFRRTLGELYARKMPLSFITDQSRTRSSAADPAVMELKDARLVYYSESDRNEKVNVAKVKEITGGETLSGRQLYKEQENFRANCNHIVTTNHRFVIETTEHAVWRRFISYKFKICFKHVCDPKNPLERPRDPDLINMIMNDKRYQEAFLSILVHYRSMLYAKYDGQILKVPHPTIVKETEEYRQSEDIFQRYIMQRVYYYKGRQQSIDELITNFRSYYRIENGEQYKAKSSDMIHTFKNSIIAHYVKESGGIYTLDDMYSCNEHESPIPGSILFSEWIKQKDN